MVVSDRASSPARGRQLAVFYELGRRHVEHILLVSSPYDSFILEEDGHLTERILDEVMDLGLRHAPSLTHVATGAEALARLEREPANFDLVITTLQIGGMSAVDLAREVKRRELGVPVVLLAFDSRELTEYTARRDLGDIDRVFVWQGDVRILLAIVKYVEDKVNAGHDAGVCGVPVVLVVEDNVQFYSSFLPMIYTELFEHSHRLLSEGVNLAHKILRMRARPKLLLAGTFEEARHFFLTYRDSLLGIISDVEFAKGGERSKSAGFDLARLVREQSPDIPVVLQTSHPEYEEEARAAGAAFLLKGSPTLLSDLRRFMVEYFGFGDFVFRMPDGTEVARARDLRSLEDLLGQVPAATIAYHGERNDFSKWLKARTELALAHRLRPRQIADYPDHEALRADLIQSIAEYRRELRGGIVADFDRQTFDGTGGFHRLGGGSVGGKARGLAFVRRILTDRGISLQFPGIAIDVPATVVVATDVFDRFLDENELRDFALNATDDAELHRRFVEAPLPDEVRSDLAAYLAHVHDPLAVRSSSLLEDSQYQPFTGIYQTYMVANAHPFAEVRLEQLMRAIKGVYASTFTQQAKAYLRATPYRLEEEKMAVILQRIVGARHGDRYYPDFAGVVRSYNFYPAPPLRPDDGIAAVALGLGRTVVEGGRCLRFCPRHPRHLIQLSSVRDTLESSQREFWALELKAGQMGMNPELEMREASFALDVAERDGTLGAVGSTWSAENDAIYDGIGRAGVRLVSFAPVLKHRLFPLADVLSFLMDVGTAEMGRPVEVEFAVNTRTPTGEPMEFGLLQMRPLALSRELEELEVGDLPDERLICRCANVLGTGRIQDIRDLLVVDFHRFERARSRDAASEIAQMAARLSAGGLPYILIGVGRWGSADPWLGIPVSWDQIAGARVIVEAGFRDFSVAPSQGTHFFQNLISFQVGFFTVDPAADFVDWDWLAAQPAATAGAFVRHIRLAAPAEVKMNGSSRQGIIAKPATA